MNRSSETWNMTDETFPYSYKVNTNRVVDKDETITVVPDKGGLEAIAAGI